MIQNLKLPTSEHYLEWVARVAGPFNNQVYKNVIHSLFSFHYTKRHLHYKSYYSVLIIIIFLQKICNIKYTDAHYIHITIHEGTILVRIAEEMDLMRQVLSLP